MHCSNEINDTQITAEFTVQAFKPSDSWSLHTVFGTESPATLTKDANKMQALPHIPRDVLLDGSFTKDDWMYVEVTIKILEIKGKKILPDITEKMIWSQDEFPIQKGYGKCEKL